MGRDNFVLAGATGHYSAPRRATSIASHSMQGWEKLLLEWSRSNTCGSDATVSGAGRLGVALREPRGRNGEFLWDGPGSQLETAVNTGEGQR